MRSIDNCPYRQKVLVGRRNEEWAQCVACARGLVVNHSLPRKLCEHCVKYDPVPNPFIDVSRKGILTSRIVEGRFPDGALHAYRVSVPDAISQLLASGAQKTKVLEGLREAVRRGMDADKAADVAEGAGLGR